MEKAYHIPAMLRECMDGLNIQPNGVYVDVTLGGGGHSGEILRRISKVEIETGEKIQIYSFDQDIEAYSHQIEIDSPLIHDSRWQFVHGNFRYLQNFMDYYGVQQIDGLIADLGVSFHHFDEAERGFSFRFAGPLDMRMNREARISAASVINTYDEESLARVLYLYGEMPYGRPLARKIIQAREQSPITRIEQLLSVLISPTFPHELPTGTELDIDSRYKKDLAKIFQALRIEVNDELGALREMLVAAKGLLRPGGRIVVLTYHSLEDRIVKNFFRSGNLEGFIEKDFFGNIITPFQVIEKGLTASTEEVAVNPRARSAKLRVAEKI